MTWTEAGRFTWIEDGTIQWDRVLEWIKRDQWTEQQHSSPLFLATNTMRTVAFCSLQDVQVNGDYFSPRPHPPFKLFLPEITLLKIFCRGSEKCYYLKHLGIPQDRCWAPPTKALRKQSYTSSEFYPLNLMEIIITIKYLILLNWYNVIPRISSKLWFC